MYYGPDFWRPTNYMRWLKQSQGTSRLLTATASINSTSHVLALFLIILQVLCTICWHIWSNVLCILINSCRAISYTHTYRDLEIFVDIRSTHAWKCQQWAPDNSCHLVFVIRNSLINIALLFFYCLIGVITSAISAIVIIVQMWQ